MMKRSLENCIQPIIDRSDIMITENTRKDGVDDIGTKHFILYRVKYALHSVYTKLKKKY